MLGHHHHLALWRGQGDANWVGFVIALGSQGFLLSLVWMPIKFLSLLSPVEASEEGTLITLRP